MSFLEIVLKTSFQNFIFWFKFWSKPPPLAKLMNSILKTHYIILFVYLKVKKKFIKNNCFQCFQRDPALRSGGIAARCLGDKWGSDKLFMRFQEVRLLFIFLRILRIENYKCIFNEDLYFYQYIYYFLWNLQVALDPSPSLFGKIYCRSFCNVFFFKSADFPTTKNRVHYQKYAFFIHPVWHRETSLNIWVIL